MIGERIKSNITRNVLSVNLDVDTGPTTINSFSDFLECDGFTEYKYKTKFCYSNSLGLIMRNQDGSP